MFQQYAQFTRAFDWCNCLFTEWHNLRWCNIYGCGSITAIVGIHHITGPQFGHIGRCWLCGTTTCCCHRRVHNRHGINTERSQFNQFKPSIQHLTYFILVRHASESNEITKSHTRAHNRVFFVFGLFRWFFVQNDFGRCDAKISLAVKCWVREIELLHFFLSFFAITCHEWNHCCWLNAQY